MIIDPHIAVIRIPLSAGADFYDKVVERILGRREQPQGILMHFSAARGDEFLVWTVFRDNAAMLEGFLTFSAMEAQNEMVAQGLAFDLTRDEYPLERLYVEPGARTQPFGMAPADGAVAKISDQVEIDLAAYHELVRDFDFFKQPVPGRICHLAYNVQGKIQAFDFWESRAVADEWYAEHVYPLYDQKYPGERSAETSAAATMELHTFLVENNMADLERHFVRESSGPMTV